MPEKKKNKIKKQIKKKVAVKKTAKSSTVENAKKKRKTAVSKSVKKNKNKASLLLSSRRSLSAEDGDAQTRNPLQSSAERLQRGGSEEVLIKKKDSARNKPIKKAEKVSSKKIENNEDQDSYFAKWTSPEFIKTNGEMLFYYASIVGSVLMIVWSFLQGSFVTVTTFVIVIAVVVFQIYRKPLDVECKIDLDGIALNLRLYRYDEIDSFEVIQGDENNVLKFKLKNAILPVKEIQLMDQDPYYIRATLEYFLLEKKQKEMLFDYEKKSEFDENMSKEEFDEYLEEASKE